MRILHLIPSLDPASGGPSRSVPDLCAAQAAAGADVSLIAFTRAAQQTAGFNLVALEPLPGTRQGITLRARQEIAAAVMEHDLVHIHSLWNPPTQIAAGAATRANVPYVISPRGMLQDVSIRRRPLMKALARPLVSRALDRATALHFLTEVERDSSTVLTPPGAEIWISPNGVDPDLLDKVEPGAFRKRLGLVDRKVILFVGRLHWSKGLDVQVDAFARVAVERDDAVWVLVGPDEGEGELLSAAIGARGLSDRVVFTGALEHDRSLEAIRDADLVLLTSRHEAHSVAMNETLVLGTPLIMTTSVGFPDAATAGAAVVADGPVELSTAIIHALENEQRTRAMGEVGRSYAREHLAWDAIARDMLDRYSRVIR